MTDETTEVQATAPDAAPASATEAKRPKIKGGRQVMSGIVHVDSTFNNTRVSISDQQGNILAWSTGGKLGYKGSRKSTAYVAQLIAVDAAKKAMATYGLREVEVRIKGPGAGRESAVRGIASAGLEITSLRDITPLPHNGCRPPKRRRV
ncbi:MAG TPA: 30S ribosomal protein S11 [Lentisphaeria bacterium]|nr:30S ribosomal protein S11 [Lentisphaerota bacterium]OQC13071.1 MAG: 30S ribosomal protein S11 [Lentisphaerae bacterium ADurb.Bin082]HPY90082.1 30S ribosomal protein S11 [Lentisphaeria bacterium]HQL87473.1 30S ribosomal protein S11 [Lentisphaeria bacterium]